MDLNSWLGIIVAVIGVFIRQAIVTPTDQQRATLLATLANDAAAVILNLTPKAEWAVLVRDVVAKLLKETSTPTTNVAVLTNAAVGALTRLGKHAPASGSGK